MHTVLIEFRKSTPYPVQLANALGDKCQVTLMLPDSVAQFADQVDREKVDLHYFSMPKLRQLSNIKMISNIREKLNKIRPDVVHITYWHPWGTLGLGIFRKFPMVTTVHDVVRHPGERGLWAIPNFAYPLQWKWADQVIVHAKPAKKKLIEKNGRSTDAVNVIPIGVYDFYRKIAKEIKPERPKTVLFFGRIWGYKGLEYLIKAEPLISKEIPDLQIVIAGHSENFDKYEQMMVNRNKFEVHNYRIPNEDVAGFFQEASIVVLPYIEASQSGVVPVAYAFGKPVVVTNVGGLPECVQDGQSGFLVPPADEYCLAKAIIKVLNDDALRNNMGKKAVQIAETDLSWERISDQTVEVYKKAISKS